MPPGPLLRREQRRLQLRHHPVRDDRSRRGRPRPAAQERQLRVGLHSLLSAGEGGQGHGAGVLRAGGQVLHDRPEEQAEADGDRGQADGGDAEPEAGLVRVGEERGAAGCYHRWRGGFRAAAQKE